MADTTKETNLTVLFGSSQSESESEDVIEETELKEANKSVLVSF